MKWPGTIALLGAALPAVAQVEVDAPLRFTGPTEERRITGLTDPATTTSAVTLGYAVRGTAHWYTAATTGDTLLLEPATGLVPVVGDGLLLRFIPPQAMEGAVHLRIGEEEPLPLLRPDGLKPLPGQVRAGAVCEVVLHGGVYTLLAPEARGCAEGFVHVHQRLCIETQDMPGLTFYQAADRCAERGAKLCSWDEYHTACTLLEGTLLGLFNGWEWIDDTSNHTHTGDQAGGTDCASQRSTVPLQTGDGRCCSRPR